MASYLPILVFTLVSIGFLVVTLLAARLLRHRGSPTTNLDPYECGNEPETFAHDHRFSIRYYLIADRQEMRIQRLAERFAPNVGLLATARVGGQTLRTAAFRTQKVSV